MKNITPVMYLYTAAVVLAIVSFNIPFMRFLAGAAALGAVWMTLAAIARRDAEEGESAEAAKARAEHQVDDLRGRLDSLIDTVASVSKAVQDEEMAERLTQIEARLEALEKAPKEEKEPSAYAGWPHRAKVKRKQNVAHAAETVDNKFFEITGVLYPTAADDKSVYCARCYRENKKKPTPVSLRPDGSAYFCDKCDTWIPTDPQDRSARTRALKKAQQAVKTGG